MISIGLVAATAAVIVPVTPGLPDFTARYENPIYLTGSDVGGPLDHYGARWFDFWKDRTGFAHIPEPTEAKNCLKPGLHFCIHLLEFLFSAPLPEAKPGVTWTVGADVSFRLLTVTTVRFRGQDIKVYAIKSDSRIDGRGFPILASVFSYSYEWGVIGYAELASDRYDIDDERAPANIGYVSALVSQHGLGGRENCKYWRCAE